MFEPISKGYATSATLKTYW